jgi:hypothetical protein
LRPPLELRIEFPLPQMPGLAAKLIRTVPLETRATLLAMLWPRATLVAPAIAARTNAVLASQVSLNVVIC